MRMAREVRTAAEPDPMTALPQNVRAVSAHACPRCGMKHRGAFDVCTRCRNEIIASGPVGPDAMPQLFAVVRAARAVAATAPTTAAHRELVAALVAMDRAWRKE